MCASGTGCDGCVWVLVVGRRVGVGLVIGLLAGRVQSSVEAWILREIVRAFRIDTW